MGRQPYKIVPKQPVIVKTKDGNINKYKAIIAIRIFDCFDRGENQFNEPVLWLHQAMGTRWGITYKEIVIPLSQIVSMYS